MVEGPELRLTKLERAPREEQNNDAPRRRCLEGGGVGGEAKELCSPAHPTESPLFFSVAPSYQMPLETVALAQSV